MSADWREEVDSIRRAAASAAYWRARTSGRAEDAWEVAVDRLVPFQLVSRQEAERMADAAARSWRAEAERLRRQLDEMGAQHRADSASMSNRLAAVRRLLDHRRKTVRMSDLNEALDR